MKYEEVDKYLINTFPDFIIDKIDEGLPYCVAGSFAYYLLKSYKGNSFNTLILAGKFIEKLYSYKSEKIDELATIGYLEAIQNVWGNNSIDPEEMTKYFSNKKVYSVFEVISCGYSPSSIKGRNYDELSNELLRKIESME